MQLLNDFPEVFDNTMRVAADSCPRKFQLAHIHHLRHGDTSIHLLAGGAYAAGLEQLRLSYFRDGEREKARYIGVGLIAAIRHWYSLDEDPRLDEVKSLPNVLCAIYYYTTQFPLGTDWLTPIVDEGNPLVEFTFAIPLEQRHPRSGNPLLYTGRFDVFAEYAGNPAVYDDKTTQRLGPSWIKQWELDSQISGYIWAAREYGYDCDTAFIRGVSFLKRSCGNAQAISHRTDFEIRDWRNTLDYTLDQMLELYETRTVFPKSLGNACKEYGGCPYVSLCKKENWREWIEPEFNVHVWNPLDLHAKKIET